MHVSLYVSNLEKTVAFYNLFFGRLPLKVRPGYAKYVLDQPSLIISFVEHPDRVQAHFGHLGFQVETIEIMNEALLRMKEMGLYTREETGVQCCYARQDKFWVNDPDGIEWEVYYFHADAEFNDPHYELENKQVKTSVTTFNATPGLAEVDADSANPPCCDSKLKESSLVSGKPCC